MGQSIAIEWALREWGARHGFTEWTHEVESRTTGHDCHTYTARTRFGVLTIRFTGLLLKRDLGTRLIAEMDKHLVGRMAKAGRWHVHALTTGHDVRVTFGEEVALDRITESSERVNPM